MQRYRFSKHALERFKERFKSRVVGGDIARSFTSLFYKSDECKSIFNNTQFMTHCYETHGYDLKPSFRTFENLLFICGQDMVITVINTNHSGFFNNQIIGKQQKRYRK